MLQDFLAITFFSNRILDYIIFLITIILGIILIRVFKAIILKSIKSWATKTANTVDDFLIQIFEKALIPILYYGIFFLSIRSLTIHPVMQKSVDVIGIGLVTVLGVRFLVALIEYTIRDHWVKRGDTADEQSLKGILPAIKVIVWGLGIIFFLDNLGFKISTVIAGLGIGGIAIAMASQAVLGDLFSYFTILFDRPFKAGDFIITGDYMGSIEHIGIKTTRIRSLGGEQLVFSNTDLTTSRLRNYKRMEQRRVVFSLGVTYDTDTARLKEIPGLLREIIKAVDCTIFDRAHFISYGDFSLIFEVVYYVTTGDYAKYRDVQQEINFTIKEEFEKRSIEFAYPTQTLYMNKAEGFSTLQGADESQS